MDMALGIGMLIAKYLFLGLIYLFLYWAFRGLFAQLEVTAASPRPVASAAVAAPPAPVAVADSPVPAAPVAAPLTPPAEPAPQRVCAALVVQDGGQSSLSAGQIIDLTAAVTLGRAEDNGVVINDKFCSGHHSLIFLQGGQRLLRDRNSTNGTLHNGQRIVQDVLLHDGDQIGIGTAVFQYRAGTQ